MPDFRDLQLLMDSRVGIIVIESHEEPRVLQLMTRLGVARQRPVHAWSVVDGLRRIDVAGAGPSQATVQAEAALMQVREMTTAGIFVFCDLHPFLTDQPKTVRLLREIAMAHDHIPHTLVLLSHRIDIPAELRRYSARMSLRLPDHAELMTLVREEAAVWSKTQQSRRVKTDNRTLDALVSHLRGLTAADARRLARGAIHDDGAITQEDMPALSRAKFDLMNMEGVLGFEYDTASFAEVGGLESLRHWLQLRREAFVSGVETADTPKGILLTGVQGCGKSLAARAAAGTLGLPLLRLDMAALYNKFIGETERNLRDALVLAETMAPCVLWVDEIEKGITVDGDTDGVSKRLLGTLLTWMAERASKVFMVATSNDIAALPPELIRKGRMDEIFFVDLPALSVRRDIFGIHLRKRGFDLSNFDLDRLAGLSEGHSGAEIEQAVVSARYAAAAIGETITTEHVAAELARTIPLSVSMFEAVSALREWAAGRTVPAS